MVCQLWPFVVSFGLENPLRIGFTLVRSWAHISGRQTPGLTRGSPPHLLYKRGVNPGLIKPGGWRPEMWALHQNIYWAVNRGTVVKWLVLDFILLWQTSLKCVPQIATK
jgi:hypothetical protein